MSVPTAPILSVRPKVTNQTLEFYWRPPSSDGGSPITSYLLSDGTNNYTITQAGYTRLSGLVNNTPYSFTLAASNTNGLGPVAEFRTVRPGFIAASPTAPSFSNFEGLKYAINWALPSSNGDSDLLGYVLTAVPLDASGELIATSPARIRRSIVGSGRMSGTIPLTTNYNWKVLVQTVNDPGYSLPTCYTSTITLATPYLLLDTIATYLRGYMSDFRNPTFYNYWLDGNGSNISDGGGDMYDSGNITTPWLRSGTQYAGSASWSIGSYPSAINYCNSTATVTDTDFYYVSLGYTQYNPATGIQDPTYLPLTVLGARSSNNQPVGWQVGGNSGADGGGTLASGLFYNNSTINTFQTYSFFREQYNAGDPSHCDLYILLGHSNWGTTFGTISTFAQADRDGCGGFLYSAGTGSRNILAIKTLLSKSNGVLVTSNECATVVQNFTLRIKQALGY